MMSRYPENSQQRNHIRRVQKQRRNHLNQQPKQQSATELRKCRKRLRLQYLNSPARQTRQSTTKNLESAVIVAEHETDASSPRDVIAETIVFKEQENDSLPNAAYTRRRSSRCSGLETTSVIVDDASMEPSIPKRRRRSDTVTANCPRRSLRNVAVQSVQPSDTGGNVQGQRRHRDRAGDTAIEEEWKMRSTEDSTDDSSEDEYEPNAYESSTESTSQVENSPRWKLRSTDTQQSMGRRSLRARGVSDASDHSSLGRRMTRSLIVNQQEPSKPPPSLETGSQDESSNKESSRIGRGRTTRAATNRTVPETPRNEPAFDSLTHSRRSVRLFLREPPVQPHRQEATESSSEQKVSVTRKTSQRNRRSDSSSVTKQKKKTREGKVKSTTAVVEENSAQVGRPLTRKSSQRQLFDSRELRGEVPVRRIERYRKSPSKFQDYECQPCRKRVREEYEAPVRRPRRSKSPAAKPTWSLRSRTSSVGVAHASPKDCLDEAPLSRSAAAKNPKTRPQETPTVRGCRRSTKPNDLFLLDYTELIKDYDALASSGRVKRVRFGPTFESTQAAVERCIRLYESVTDVAVDQDILTDEKQYKKSLKAHASFEAQERLNILEDVVYEVDDEDSGAAEEALEALASTPIVWSDQVRIRSRSSRCIKDCHLCPDPSKEQAVCHETTFTPGIISIQGFDLDDGIRKNTLNALKRLARSLTFVKENNGAL